MWQLLDLIYLENYEPRWLLIRLKNYLLFSVITFQLYYQLRYNKRLAKYFLTFISILSVRGFRKTSILRKVIPKIIRYKKMETYLNNITPLAENNRISTYSFMKSSNCQILKKRKNFILEFWEILLAVDKIYIHSEINTERQKFCILWYSRVSLERK